MNNPREKEDRIWPELLLLIAITIIVYAVSFFNGFVRDDELIIVNNPQTLSLQSIPDVLFGPDVIKPYYRPLNRATYLLDYRIAGMNAAWYHGVNILLHAGNVLLLYLVCRRLFPDRTAALIAALLFAVHPANSEAVNFISARNTVLALFFTLASFLAFMRAREQGRQLPLLSALLFFCGLLSKETAFMLVVIIALYTVVPLPGQEGREQGKRRYIILFPFLFAMLMYFAMRTYALHDLVGTSVPSAGLLDRLYQNVTIIPQYFALLVFPLDLTIYHTAVPRTGIVALPGVLFAVWIAILAGLWLLFRRGDRAMQFGIVWCVVNYAPISNIVPIPADPITERFLYMPSVGFFIVVGSLLNSLALQKRWKYQYWTGAAAVLLVFSILTVQRSLDWKNEIILNTSGVMNNPSSASAHYNLGTALRDRGDLAGAVHEWQRALQIDSTNSDSLIQMGTYFAMQGDLQKAEEYYNAALRAPRGIADVDKSMAYYNLGKIRERQGRPLEAIEEYEMFLNLVPLQYEEYRANAEQRIAALRHDLTRDRIR
jgi:protein O-mannosyl-transferase